MNTVDRKLINLNHKQGVLHKMECLKLLDKVTWEIKIFDENRIVMLIETRDSVLKSQLTFQQHT